MPKTAASPAPRTGRPKRYLEPRRNTSFRIEHDNAVWIDENLPRSIPIGVFINEAIREKI